MHKIGDKIKVNIEDPINETCEAINGAIGVISDKDDWVYPYTVKLDDSNLNELITDVEPRRFAASELIVQ